MRTVLVVDDDPGTRESFSAILKLEGIPAVTASTAEEGLATAGQIDCGLILADLRLPKRTRIDLVADLRAKGIDTPVVIITAYATPRNVVAAMQAGAVDCLEKPIDEVTLLRVARDRLRWRSGDRDDDESLAARAVILIRRDFQRQGLTVRALARDLRVSESHLCRAFKALTERTPGAALRDARASHAQTLLQYTALSVKAVAFTSGFASVKGLEDALQQRTGLTPTEYRRTHR